jgi:tight adherence protein B
MDPTYITVLFTEPLGWVMIGSAVLMEIIGIFIVRKIVRIEV